LPPFLGQRYELRRARVADTDTTLIVPRDAKEFSPAAFEKHLRRLPEDVGKAYVVLAEDLPAYVRYRLVRRGVPFVVPGVQLYWPELGLAVRARARRARAPRMVLEKVGPATQVVIIAALRGVLADALAARDVANRLGYTQMTMTRVFDELETVGLARTARRAHKRELHLRLHGKELWTAARQKLRNPVRKTVRVRTDDLAGVRPLLGGESALAEMSMLAAPERPVYAVGPGRWLDLRATRLETIPVDDEDTCLLQAWWYDPGLFEEDGHVDPFSLFLSLDGAEDERVASALEEMMEKIAW